MHIVDRRLNPSGKNLANRQRFMRRAKAQTEHQIIPGNGDHILMLDSSWSLPRIYNKVMRQARLRKRRDFMP